ncbi:glycosyl transferase 2 family protein [Mycobacterium intracellulare 1956]|uniref:Glycosyl transferase 2 family protein n=3 Tax=Mycobacteriaceae TaxID=1762 RepID=X8CGX1_MYCIT|nr:glycosyl transferase 2 family protein [Mycobacterium intracellulare]EUA55076.1 glycosyl transferase 2 family protein [Mycobacterium intracellulare 1956]
MSAPTFSIIVPTFNSAATLQACIESITRQTYTDYELVLVDGASTDGTIDIAN